MEQLSAPLADYFWIAGVDSLSYGQEFQLNPTTGEKTVLNASVPAPPVAETINEDQILEAEEAPSSPTVVSTPNSPEPSRPNSFQRLSHQPRLSIQSVTTVKEAPSSNRSSATIKGVEVNSMTSINDNRNSISSFTEFDFDIAMKKFTVERDKFLDDLSFSAGTVLASRPRKHPRTQKIIHEDGIGAAGGLRSGTENLIRRISFRDLGSAKRPPLSRSASVRTSRRLSNYNSVIPMPQPLNVDPNMHPLKRKFEPVLLDRYPPKGSVEENKGRASFPDYVPMFAFPNDINIVSSDEKPRATWHGFAMTTNDGSKLHGICLTLWMALSPLAAEEIEKKCEEWRRDNMTNEERELAASLGERLATERAKLSQLLAKLPAVASGSAAREALEDEISGTEEKIGMMTDMLRPVRHGAASKIDGLTDGETGLWIPRVYGILGKDPDLTGFWKEWLRAVVVPMTKGGILRIPPSSPRIGMWQPLERYVINLCQEAPIPVSSKTQVEIAVRELRLYARKTAINEIPGSRNTDIYSLFRSLSIPNVITLFEFALAESRIILLSSHTAMLSLASRALISLMYPFTWMHVFIPVLPARLLTALEAPFPYIVGIERRYEKIELPEDDFVIVDLDQNLIESTRKPSPLPRQQRRKLQSLLQLAAPHHNRYGVAEEPPAYAVEAFPFDSYGSEMPSIYNQAAASTQLAKYVSMNSASFGTVESGFAPREPILNAFIQSRNDHNRHHERPSTAATSKGSSASPPSPNLSPTGSHFPVLPTTPISRNDSGFALTATLREKRSGHFDAVSRRSSSVRHLYCRANHVEALTKDTQFGFGSHPPIRRPSLPFSNHSSSVSVGSSSNADCQSFVNYAPSIYAASTIAASTIMPQVLHHQVRNTATTSWVEGHCLEWRPKEDNAICSVCDERVEDGMFQCSGCPVCVHGRCSQQLAFVCHAAFNANQVRAAFVRCFASLLYTYRKFLQSPTADAKKSGKIYSFNFDGFIRSLPHENAEYMQMLQQTQGFSEFIHDRETRKPNDSEVVLFDQIILSKKNRGRVSMFSKSSELKLIQSRTHLASLSSSHVPPADAKLTETNFLSDTSDHLWVTAAATPPSSRFPGEYRLVTSRIPSKLEEKYMKAPRSNQGVPRMSTAKARRKPIPSLLNPNTPSGAFDGTLVGVAL